MSEPNKRSGRPPFDTKLVFDAADSIWRGGEGRVPELKDILLQVKGTTQTICNAFQDWTVRRLGAPSPTPIPAVLAKAINSFLESEHLKSEAHWGAVVKGLRNDVQHLNGLLSAGAEEIETVTAQRQSVAAQYEQLKGQMQQKDEIIDRLQHSELEAREKVMDARVGEAERDKEHEYLLKHSNGLEQTIDELKRELAKVRAEATAAKIDLASIRGALDARMLLLTGDGTESGQKRGTDESREG